MGLPIITIKGVFWNSLHYSLCFIKAILGGTASTIQRRQSPRNGNEEAVLEIHINQQKRAWSTLQCTRANATSSISFVRTVSPPQKAWRMQKNSKRKEGGRGEAPSLCTEYWQKPSKPNTTENESEFGSPGCWFFCRRAHSFDLTSPVDTSSNPKTQGSYCWVTEDKSTAGKIKLQLTFFRTHPLLLSSRHDVVDRR